MAWVWRIEFESGAEQDNARFYKRYVPVADRLYDVYLEELRQEGLIR